MSIKMLVGRLSSLCKDSFEHGARLCVSSGHYAIDVPHVLIKLLSDKESDFVILLNHYGVSVESVQAELTALMEKFKKGCGATPTMSPNVVNLLEHSWMLTSVEMGQERIRSGAILCSLLSGKGLIGWTLDNLPALMGIPRDQFGKEWEGLLHKLPEGGRRVATSSSSEDTVTVEQSQTPTLDKYSLDFTALAQEGKLSPVVGRDKQIRQLVDVLSRSRQNNPMLLGEAGVGKTALVEGLAMCIEQNDAPDMLKGVRIVSLDVGSLEAGAGMKGEFEQRLTDIIKEIQQSSVEIILFVDEAHVLLGSEKKNDAANLLKPPLARGELRTIAATTWMEYKKYIEKDAALVRRFQVVNVPEPEEEIAVGMVRLVAQHLAKRHDTVIMDDAIRAAVRLTKRYVGDRRLPDKAVSALDTACARVRISQKIRPLVLEEMMKEKAALNLEQDMLKKDLECGVDCHERVNQCVQRKDILAQEIEKLTKQWEKEKDLVNAVLSAIQSQNDSEVTKLKQDLESLRKDQNPMVFPFVCADNVGQVVESWTGIPMSDMVYDDTEVFLSVEKKLKERVIGQEYGVALMAKNMIVHQAKLDAPDKPIGSFLLVGPSGVGKTETALVLSEIFFGGSPIVVNMSEYQEAHSVATLRGSPPGYVGYGQGGVLTEAVRRNPYSVVLLDEIEKAHPDVLEVFFQVLDKGVLEDGEGVRVDFKNTVILMTSNTGTEVITQAAQRGESNMENVITEVYPTLKKVFQTAFLGRLSVVPYYPLTKEAIASILDIKWKKVADRVKQNHAVDIHLSKDAQKKLIEYGCTEDSGARVLDRTINRQILPILAEKLLQPQKDKGLFVQWDGVRFVLDQKG